MWGVEVSGIDRWAEKRWLGMTCLENVDAPASSTTHPRCSHTQPCAHARSCPAPRIPPPSFVSAHLQLLAAMSPGCSRAQDGLKLRAISVPSGLLALLCNDTWFPQPQHHTILIEGHPSRPGPGTSTQAETLRMPRQMPSVHPFSTDPEVDFGKKRRESDSRYSDHFPYQERENADTSILKEYLHFRRGPMYALMLLCQWPSAHKNLIHEKPEYSYHSRHAPMCAPIHLCQLPCCVPIPLQSSTQSSLQVLDVNCHN